MERALGQFVVEGVYTSIPLDFEILADDDFLAGNFNTKFMDKFLERRKAKLEA